MLPRVQIAVKDGSLGTFGDLGAVFPCFLGTKENMTTLEKSGCEPKKSGTLMMMGWC